MKIADFIQILLYFSALIVLTPLVGLYLLHVFEGRKHFMFHVLKPVEKIIYQLSGIDSTEEMNWKKYTVGILPFNLAGYVFINGFSMILFFQP
jgi:potassium-transporting ATPase potassium-binding subunit